MTDDQRLQGRVALVTGAGRGIGRAIALKLAREGAAVVLNDLDAAPANEVASEIAAGGGRAVVCAGSVAAQDFGERFVRTALDQFGDVHIIVNNAGYTWDNVIQKMSDEQFTAMLDVHVTGPFRILRAAAEPIRARVKQETAEGREVYRKVVNISSIAGTGGSAGQVNYSAAKMAIIGVTKSLAKEWGRYRVNVNAVAFGYIRTRLTVPLESEAANISIEGRQIRVGVQSAGLEMMEKVIPLGRAGTPEEAAGAVYLFCSPESNYVSGQTIVCGGGFGQVF